MTRRALCPIGLNAVNRLTRLGTPLVLVALLLVGAMTSSASARFHTDRPKVSGFSFSPDAFAVGPMKSATRARRATTIHFTLSKRAAVRITLSRAMPGRRSGRRCAKPRKRLAKRKACTRYVVAGRIARRRLKAGPVAIAFSGRVHGRALPGGRYRATITATGAGHHRSVPKTLTFSIGAGAGAGAGTSPSGAKPPSSPSAPAPAGAQRRVVRSCSQTVSSVAAVQSAVAAAAPGAVICLANGTYGKLSLRRGRRARSWYNPRRNPGGTTIGGASMSRLQPDARGRFNVAGDEVAVEPGLAIT